MSAADQVTQWMPILWFLFAVVILTILYLSGTLSRLAERITKVGGFGLSFEFTEKSARETRDSVEQSLGAIRGAIKRNLAAGVRTAGLQEAFATVVDETDLKGKKGYRTTIHIPDPLYANQLFQLLDYHPKGGGAGRTFSARSGIIGIAWRNLRSDKWHQDSEVTQRELMRQWGMTQPEARNRESADSKKLFLAVPLRDKTGAIPIGVFYLDAESPEELGIDAHPSDPGGELEDVEGRADEFLNRIEEQFTAKFKEKMAEPLAELVKEAKRTSPQLDLEGQ